MIDLHADQAATADDAIAGAARASPLSQAGDRSWQVAGPIQEGSRLLGSEAAGRGG